MLTVDRKHKQAWSGKIGARLVMLSNELPKFGDASGALASRFVILTMTRSFLGEEDAGLFDELVTELPGILNWALAGLARLQEQRRLSEPAGSKDAVEALTDLVSPISAFHREVCVSGADQSAPIPELYEHFRTWCEENGHYPSSIQMFGRDLRAIQPQLKQFRPHGGQRWFSARRPLRTGAEIQPRDDQNARRRSWDQDSQGSRLD